VDLELLVNSYWYIHRGDLPLPPNLSFLSINLNNSVMEKDLFATLNQVHPVPFSLQSTFADIMRLHTFKKNHIILKTGEVNRRIYFITHGLLRAYSLKDGLDVSRWIKGDGEFVVSIASFYPQVPSFEVIQALEDTQAFSINHEELFAAYLNHPQFTYIGLKLTIDVLVEWDERSNMLQMTRAEERFKWFMKRKAHLLDRIPVKVIASYLSMTPETLSRVRAKHNRTNRAA